MVDSLAVSRVRACLFFEEKEKKTRVHEGSVLTPSLPPRFSFRASPCPAHTRRGHRTHTRARTLSTMGRHSKNAGTMGAEALTYHERRALGYGTVKERLGKVCAVVLGGVDECSARLRLCAVARCQARISRREEGGARGAARTPSPARRFAFQRHRHFASPSFSLPLSLSLPPPRTRSVTTTTAA